MKVKAWTLHVPDDPFRQAIVKAQRQSLDPIPLETVEDKHRWGPLVTAFRAWSAAARSDRIDWHLFMNDDVAFTTPPGPHLAQLAALDPAYISLFCSKNTEMKQALDKSQQWLSGPGIIYGAAYLLHHSLVTDLYDHARRWAPFLDRDYQHDDGILAIWAEHRQIPCWATVPSLVQHVGYNRSLLGHSGRTIAKHTASQPISWSSPTSDAPFIPAHYGNPSKRQIRRLKQGALL